MIDFVHQQQDSISALPDELRGAVEEAIREPRDTIVAIWRKFGLDKEGGEHYIPRATFYGNAGERRQWWVARQKEAAVRALRTTLDAIDEAEKEIGDLPDAALKIQWRDLVADMAGDGVEPRTLAIRARTINDLATAIGKSRSEGRAAEEWEVKRAALKRAEVASAKIAERDPQAAYELLRSEVRELYGIELKSATAKDAKGQ